MFVRVLSAALLLMACCTAPVAPQEKEAALDALYWLPDGTYGYLAFAHWTGMQTTAVFADYGDLFSNSEFSSLVDGCPIPETAREGLEWICTARLMRLRIADEAEMEQMSQARTVITMNDDGGMKTRKEKPSREEVLARSVRNDEGTFWVAAFEDTAGLVKEAVSGGWLSATGVRCMGRPIYSLSGREGSERNSGYAYATVTNELLLADEIEMLEEMVASGMGQGSSFVYSAAFNDLAAYIPDFGQSWRVSVMRAHNVETIDLLAEYPELEERVESLEEQLREGLQYEIVSHEFGDTIIEKRICIFGSDDYAAESAREIENNLRNTRENSLQDAESITITAMNDDGEVDRKRTGQLNRLFKRSTQFAGDKAGKTEVILEDNVVTTVFIWDERQLHTMRMLNNAAEATRASQLEAQIQITSEPKEQPHHP